MGFGPFSSESRSTSKTYFSDNKIGASDNAIVNAPRLSTGKNSTLIGPGATLIKAGRDLIVQQPTDTQIFTDAVGAVSEQSNRSFETLSDLFAGTTAVQLAAQEEAAASSKSLVQETFGRLSDLAKNVQTGGEDGRNKIILWLSLAALAVVGYVAIKRLR